MDEYTNAWDLFFETGNITDYLEYKQGAGLKGSRQDDSSAGMVAKIEQNFTI